jgi:hypothetical protein
VDELLALLAKAKALGVSGKKLVDLFDMVKDVDKLIQLLDQVKSAEKLEQLLLRLKKDADLLIELLKRSKDADELASLLAKVDDERKLLKLLDALEPADRPFLSQLLDTEKDVDKILQRLEEAKQARTSGVPIGIDPAKFAAASQRAAEMLRGMGYTFEEIVCEGSRVRGFSLEKGAGGALEPLLKPMDATRDLDMAVRVSASEFERVWQASFGRASAGSALEETGRHAREVGKITAGAARPRISSVRDAIVAMLGIEKGDLSIVRSGSSFGGGTVIPMK